MNTYINFEPLQKNEYSSLNKAEKKLYLIKYQKAVNEIRERLIYASNFSPNKKSYYNFLLINLLNSAPPQIR